MLDIRLDNDAAGLGVVFLFLCFCLVVYLISSAGTKR